jgi:hypothetical protein
MYVTRYGEVTDVEESFLGEANRKLLVAIADFRRVADRYQETSVGISTRILFYDGPVEEYRVNDGFWFRSERHRAYFGPGDTRRLVVAIFDDGFLMPYDGKFKTTRPRSVSKHNYFEVYDNKLRAEKLRVIVELVGVSPKNVTVLSISARYELTLNPPEFTLKALIFMIKSKRKGRTLGGSGPSVSLAQLRLACQAAHVAVITKGRYRPHRLKQRSSAPQCLTDFHPLRQAHTSNVKSCSSSIICSIETLASRA